MSANIFWRTVKKGKDLEVGSPSSFIEMFINAFEIPATLTETDIPILNGMRIGSDYHKEPLERIINAIREHRAIEIYAEY